MERKSTVVLTAIAVLTLLIAVIGATFAYFTVRISGNESATSTIIKTANIKITYTKGNDISIQEGVPGASGILTFSVENDGDETVDYYVRWSDVVNTFYEGAHPEELVYSVDCRDGSNNALYTASNVIVPSVNALVSINSGDPISIAPGVTHNYSITVTFLEMSSVQNYNQGKTFSSAIEVELADNQYFSTSAVYSGESSTN